MRPLRQAVVLVVAAVSAAAHAATVSGKVFVQLGAYWDRNTRDSVRDLSAQLWTPVLLDTTRTETDSTGAFRFENVPAGRHTLRCEVFGTKGASAVIHVDTADVERANLIVQPDYRFRPPREERDVCYRLYAQPGTSPALDVDSLPNPYVPADHAPAWGQPGPTLYNDEFSAMCGVASHPENLRFEELFDPVCWCKSRDTLWLITSTNNTLIGGCECGADPFWLRASADGGRHWGPPLSLGIVQEFLFWTKQMRVAVEGEWLFLDIGYPANPPLPGRQVMIRLATLRSDRDGDGLTDLSEPLYGLDPDNPDTDGDSLRDKADPNPLVDEEKTDAISEIVGGRIEELGGDRRCNYCPDESMYKVFTDTADILARRTRIVVFDDGCQRAVPVESGWVLCMDPRYSESFNTRIGCYFWSPTSVTAIDPSGTQAIVSTSCEKSWSRHRVALCGDRWHEAGCVGWGE